LEGIFVEASVIDTGADCTVVPDYILRKMEQAGLTLRRSKQEKHRVFAS
jgi:predicted aspartyl protease